MAVSSEAPITEPVPATRLRAVVHIDMVGYSRLIELDTDGTVARLRALRRDVIDPQIARYGARIVNTAGDSILLEFTSVTAAVAWALEVQGGVASADDNRAAKHEMRFRIGIDIGEVLPEGTDLYGDSVNIAARLQSCAITSARGAASTSRRSES